MVLSGAMFPAAIFFLHVRPFECKVMMAAAQVFIAISLFLQFAPSDGDYRRLGLVDTRTSPVNI